MGVSTVTLNQQSSVRFDRMTGALDKESRPFEGTDGRPRQQVFFF
jgi:hypothetical protein